MRLILPALYKQPQLVSLLLSRDRKKDIRMGTVVSYKPVAEKDKKNVQLLVSTNVFNLELCILKTEALGHRSF